MLDTMLFVLLPYAVVFTAIAGSIYRLRVRRFTVTSLSSQFLEGGELFFGSVPWHYGILVVLTGHLIGFLFPREVLLFNSVPVRLFILELTGLTFGLLALVGIVGLIVRRLTTPRIRAVTTTMDLVLLAVLAVQVISGIYVALFNRWGSNWFAASLVPYLRSLFVLAPDTAVLAPLPWMIKLHITGLFALVALLPFSRLIHALVPPISYLWRPFELVIWNGRQSRGASRFRAGSSMLAASHGRPRTLPPAKVKRPLAEPQAALQLPPQRVPVTPLAKDRIEHQDEVTQ